MKYCFSPRGGQGLGSKTTEAPARCRPDLVHNRRYNCRGEVACERREDYGCHHSRGRVSSNYFYHYIIFPANITTSSTTATNNNNIKKKKKKKNNKNKNNNHNYY